MHKTDGFSGAELEEVVVNALYEAYASPERELKTEHLLKAAAETVPLTRSRAREMGVSGVPFFIFDGKTAVSGAQEAATLLEAIVKARTA